MPKESKRTEGSFFSDFDGLIVHTCHSDAYILRCGSFRADDDDRQQTKAIALPLAHACSAMVDPILC